MNMNLFVYLVLRVFLSGEEGLVGGMHRLKDRGRRIGGFDLWGLRSVIMYNTIHCHHSRETEKDVYDNILIQILST
jgi:hypothetical protein